MSQPLPKPDIEPESTSGAEEQRAISAILERDAAVKRRIADLEAKRSKKRQWGGVLAVVSGLCALYLWFGNPEFLQRKPTPGPSAQNLHAGARLSLYLLGCRIEEYRREHGKVPERLDALGSVPGHVSFVRREGDYYVLRYDGVDPPLVYDSEFGNLAQLSGVSMQTLGVLTPEKRP